jgi:hypothetical protein
MGPVVLGRPRLGDQLEAAWHMQQLGAAIGCGAGLSKETGPNLSGLLIWTACTLNGGNLVQLKHSHDETAGD